jgi:hypothetical protein
LSVLFFIRFIRNGQDQADRTQVHRRKSPQETTGYQSGEEKRSRHWRRQEAPPLQTRVSEEQQHPENFITKKSVLFRTSNFTGKKKYISPFNRK